MSGTVDPWAKFNPQDQAGDPWAKFNPQSAPMQQPAPDPATDITADNIVRQMAKGATFNLSDEIAAGGRAAVGAVGDLFQSGGPTMGERYGAALAEERGRDKAFEAAHPFVGIGAQIAGGVMNPLGRYVMPESLLGRTAGNIGVGALFGGAQGFGEGEGGFVNRMGPAALGAVTGGVLGGVLPPIVEGASRAGRWIGNKLGMNIPRTDAERLALQRLEQGGVTLPAARAELDAAGNQPMMLADVGGEALAGQASAVGRMPGAGRQQAADVLTARGGVAQSARLGDEVKRAISADDFAGTIDDLMRARTANAGPAYQRALAIETPVNVKPILDEIEARLGSAKGDIKSALTRARSLFRTGSGAIDTTMAGLHETKLALDAMLEKSPTNSISRVARRELMGVQEKLLAAMDDASGGAYAEARAAFAGPSRAMDAMDVGKRVLKGDADETAAEIAALSPSERDFFRIGVARALVDRVKSGGDTADLTKLKSIWGSEAVRERVRAAFDNADDFDRFSQFMQRELTMAQTNRLIDPRGGSPTAILQQYNQQANEGQQSAIVRGIASALRGDAVGAGANAVRAATSGQRDVSGVYDELAQMIFAMKPGDRARVLDRLEARQGREAMKKASGRAIGSALLKGATAGAVGVEN